jgi:hypothetical protein
MREVGLESKGFPRAVVASPTWRSSGSHPDNGQSTLEDKGSSITYRRIAFTLLTTTLSTQPNPQKVDYIKSNAKNTNPVIKRSNNSKARLMEQLACKK